MAEVKMSLLEYTAHQQALLDSQKECAELRKKLAEAELADPSGVVPSLARAAHAARAILPMSMQFVPPAQWTKKFAASTLLEHLKVFADAYEIMPGAGEDCQVVAIDLRDFIGEVLDGSRV